MDPKSSSAALQDYFSILCKCLVVKKVVLNSYVFISILIIITIAILPSENSSSRFARYVRSAKGNDNLSFYLLDFFEGIFETQLSELRLIALKLPKEQRIPK